MFQYTVRFKQADEVYTWVGPRCININVAIYGYFRRSCTNETTLC